MTPIVSVSKAAIKTIIRPDALTAIAQEKLEYISNLTLRSVGEFHYGLNHKTSEYLVLDEVGFLILQQIQKAGFVNPEAISQLFDGVDAATVAEDAIAFLGQIGTGLTATGTEETISTVQENDILDFFATQKIPASVTIEVTERCNETCIHCYRPDPKQIGIEVWQPETFEKLCKELKAIGVLQLDFTGGEPFMHKGFDQLLQIAGKHGFTITLLTNGVLLNADRIRLLKTLKTRMVYISVYSANADIHDTVTRKPNSFKRTKNALDMLYSANIPLCINSPIMTVNKDCPAGLKQFANEYKADIKYTYKISTSYNPNTQSENYNIYSVQELSKNMMDKDINLYSEIRQDPERVASTQRTRYCDAGFRSFAISPEGEAMLCTALRKPCGNIKKQSIVDIWESSQTIEQWRHRDSIIKGRCSSCERLNFCEPCPAEHYNRTGSLNGVDQNACQFGHALYGAIKIVEDR